MMSDLSMRGIPNDARVFTLRPKTKKPLSGTRGHHDAVPALEYIDLGGNIGIALDGTFLVVDFDRDHPMRVQWEAQLPVTWTQETPGGVHRLYRVPDGWRSKNVKITPDGGETLVGDVKVHGYIVGPESYVDADRGRPAGTYRLLDSRDPVPAPQWLLQYVEEAQPATEGGVEREGIPHGTHDDFLTQFAGWLRGRYGLSENAMKAALPGMLPLLEGYDEANPYTEYDFARIARSAAKWAAGEDLGPLMASTWENGADISLVGPPERWWIPGFIPGGHLVMLYAKGGVGKTSFLSWVASEITIQGGIFGGFLVEEQPRSFLRRAVIGGGVRERMYFTTRASAWQFPRDAAKLEEAIKLQKLDVVYFDSIASHMDATPGLNIAERTRKSLAPLAELAQSLGIAIVCVFHENKAGEFGGSVEMVNVARHVLHAKRKPGGPLQIRVKKTNLEDVGLVLQFEADEHQVVEPQTGEVQQRWTPEGLAPALTKVLRAIDPIPVSEDVEDDEEGVVVQGPARGKALAREIEALLRVDVNLTNAEIAAATGASEATVKRYTAQVRRMLGGEE